MTNSTHLALPFIDAAQSQKHVTHNDALSIIDIELHLSVLARNILAPPVTAVEGMRYLLGTGASGAFAGNDGALAAYQDGAWRFARPQKGWRAYIEADNSLALFDGTNWFDLGTTLKVLQNLTFAGIGTAGDATSPLAAKLNATLFTAKGAGEGGTGDLRFKLNKEAVANVASQLYQTGYSGRAETGLLGNDHFHIKVSTDGSIWKDALDIDPATGIVSFPGGTSGISQPPPSFQWNGTQLRFQNPDGSFGAWVDLKGPVGATGVAGATGASGPVGPPGQTGATGLVGASGATGAIGPIGPLGATGSTGAPGLAGGIGPAGPAGALGPVGATGLTGPAGLAGAIGAVGPAGATGATGATGLTGAIGPTGLTGGIGPVGLAGAVGATGATGLPGGVGPSGSVGATGSTGPAGLAGAIGPAGPAGASGPAGAIGMTGAIGPAGATGATGSTGTPGVAGTIGPTGPAGAIGAVGGTGATGLTGAIGPAGAIGMTGAIGPAGATGATGATGSTGTPGVAGTIGPTGPAGAIGAVGGTGATGLTGAIGTSGPVGATGLTGAAGATGPAGAQGSTGPSGPAGTPADPSTLNAAVSAAQGAASTASTQASAAASSLAALNLAGTTGNVAFAAPATYATSITPIASASTKFSTLIDASGFLNLIQTQASPLFIGATSAITRRIGRIYSGVYVMTSTLFTSNTGVILGFNPGLNTGTAVPMDIGAIAWIWRSGGTLYAASPTAASGEITQTAYAPSASNPPAYVAGDVLTMYLTENANGSGTLNLSQRTTAGAVTNWSTTVPAIGTGYLFAGFRLQGGGVGAPETGILRQMGYNDPVPVASSVTTQVVAAPTVLANSLFPALPMAASLTGSVDPNGYRIRAAPPGFPALPYYPVQISAPGQVRLTQSAMSAYFAANPQLGSAQVAFVEKSGNDATAQLNNANLPYLTLAAALASAGGLILVGPGVWNEGIDYRFTGLQGGVPRALVARLPGLTILRMVGDDLTANTFVATIGQAGVYQTAIAAAGTVQRLLRRDMLDNFGFQLPVPKLASVSSVQVAGTGWFYDTVGRILYVALAGQNLFASHGNLRALYLDASGNSRVFAQGATLMLHGFWLDGLSAAATPYNNAGVAVASGLWLSSCWAAWSPIFAVQGDAGCTLVLDNCRLHASASDGVNCDSTRNPAPTGANALALVSGSYITACGDVATFGTLSAPSKKAISSQVGYLAAFGSTFSQSWGPEVADASASPGSGMTSLSWYAGCIAYNGDTRIAQKTGFGFYGTTSTAAVENRKAWLDTCWASNEGSGPLWVQDNASTKIFNTTLDASPAISGGSVVPLVYAPETP